MYSVCVVAVFAVCIYTTTIRTQLSPTLKCVASVLHTKRRDGFGILVVSILAIGTRVRGFKPGRRRWIFRASGKSSVYLPSEGK